VLQYFYLSACVAGSRPKSGSFSSSGRSESSAGGAVGASSGNETEEGEVKARHLLVANHGSNGGRVLVKIRPPQLPARQQREASCSTNGRQSSDEDDDDDDDDDDDEGDSNSSALSGETDTSPAGHSMEDIPRPISSSASNLKMRIVAPDRRRVITRQCLPRGSIQARLAHSEADLFAGHMHLPQLTQKSAKYGKMARQHKQLTPEEDDAAQMSDSEDPVMQHIKMKVVHRAAERGGICGHPGDEEDEEEDYEDEDGEEEEEEEEESSEYASSPDSTPNAAAVDPSTTPKSCRRRHGENLNSDEEGTPKRKRSKSDVDAEKTQLSSGAGITKIVSSKESGGSVNKMLTAEVSVTNDAGGPSPAEQEQSSASVDISVAQVFISDLFGA